jgi:hypothetical protein
MMSTLVQGQNLCEVRRIKNEPLFIILKWGFYFPSLHPCLMTIGQSEFNQHGIVVGSRHCDTDRFHELQPSIIDVVDIMAKVGDSIVFAKSHRLQTQAAGCGIDDIHTFIIPGIEITGNYKRPLVF